MKPKKCNYCHTDFEACIRCNKKGCINRECKGFKGETRILLNYFPEHKTGWLCAWCAWKDNTKRRIKLKILTLNAWIGRKFK